MKRFLAISFMLLFILCLSLNSWAGGASVFHHSERWIIRVYHENNNIMLEVKNTGNQLIPAASIEWQKNNPHTIASNISNDNVSLAFDENTSTAFIFYYDVNTPAFAAIDKIRSFVSISANPTSVPFGDKNINTLSESPTITVTNNGTSQITSLSSTVTGNSFDKHVDTCLGALAGGANCTIVVRFAPTASGIYKGNLRIQSSGGNIDIPLSGTGVQQSSSNVDLVITSVTTIKGGENNLPFSVSLTIKNQGTSTSGPFKVKGYFSMDQIPNNGGTPPDQLLFESDIPGLIAGQSLSKSFSNLRFQNFPAHTTAFIVIKVDADNAVTETNEGNNIFTRAVTIAR